MSVTKMSLDNNSQPGRPGPDELVPSRYAVRVGEIDVRVISDGVHLYQARCWATMPMLLSGGLGLRTISSRQTFSSGR